MVHVSTQLATTTEFMQRIFVPKAAAHGAEVEATILRSDPDSSAAIGEVKVPAINPCPKQQRMRCEGRMHAVPV
jgi:hypothetical protein